MALVTTPFVLQVVGYQDSGKTTTMVKLIERLEKTTTVRFVTIKHHGHGGEPDLPEKDSSRHHRAGGLAAVVEGDGLLLLQSKQKVWTLEEKISLCSHFQPELVLVEGHKQASYPKIVLVRHCGDFHLLKQLKDIRAVLYWNNVPPSMEGTKLFSIKEDHWIDWATTFIQQHIG